MSNTILKVHHLTKAYGAKTVLKDVSFHVEKGKIYGFIGENGAGKTTTIRAITGLTSVKEGAIELYKVLERVGLGGVSNKKVKDFSLGMKQRLGIAMALINGPELLILEAPETQAALKILTEHGVKSMSSENESIKIYDDVSIEDVAMWMLDARLLVTLLMKYEKSLENYYMELLGGKS